jgi:hypothetical protein
MAQEERRIAASAAGEGRIGDCLARTRARSTSRSGMTEPVKPKRDRLAWLAIVVVLAASIAFGLIAVAVADRDPILARDLQVLVWLHTHGNPVFTASSSR